MNVGVFFMVESVVIIACRLMAAEMPDKYGRGPVFSFFYGAFDSGVIAAGATLGLIADLTSIREMFIIVSIGGFICLIIFSLFIKKGLKKSLRWSLIYTKH